MAGRDGGNADARRHRESDQRAGDTRRFCFHFILSLVSRRLGRMQFVRGFWVRLEPTARGSPGAKLGKIGGARMRSLRVRFEEFELDTAQVQLLRAGEPVHLTPMAFRLLAFLVEAAPRVVPKAELHSHLWPNGVVTDETLAGLVKEVRKALADATREPPFIRTAYRVGYAFCGDL